MIIMSFHRTYSYIYIYLPGFVCIYVYKCSTLYLRLYYREVFAKKWRRLSSEICHLTLKERLIHNYINSSMYKASSRLIFIAVVAWGPFSVGEDCFLHFANCRKRFTEGGRLTS